MHKTYKTYKTYKMMMGAPVFALTGYAAASHVIPRGFAVPLCGMARAKSYRGGDYCSSVPQIKDTVFTVFTVFTVSAARRV